MWVFVSASVILHFVINICSMRFLFWFSLKSKYLHLDIQRTDVYTVIKYRYIVYMQLHFAYLISPPALLSSLVITLVPEFTSLDFEKAENKKNVYI